MTASAQTARQWRLARAAVRLARRRFGDELLLAFVGGSYAARRAKPDSDIDVFLVLRAPQPDAETAFADDFRAFHAARGLRFEHYGEIFDRETLEHLLARTERWLESGPELQHVGCYHGDCLLSAFRKGDVVMKFLADPKWCIHGDRGYLGALQARARRFFDAFPMERVQLAKGMLTFIDQPRLAALEESLRARAARADRDTPQGIGLQRWFGRGAMAPPLDTAPRRATMVSTAASRCQCPLNRWSDGEEPGGTIRNQCLGLIAHEER